MPVRMGFAINRLPEKSRIASHHMAEISHRLWLHSRRRYLDCSLKKADRPPHQGSLLFWERHFQLLPGEIYSELRRLRGSLHSNTKKRPRTAPFEESVDGLQD